MTSFSSPSRIGKITGGGESCFIYITKHKSAVTKSDIRDIHEADQTSTKSIG